MSELIVAEQKKIKHLRSMRIENIKLQDNSED